MSSLIHVFNWSCCDTRLGFRTLFNCVAFQLNCIVLKYPLVGRGRKKERMKLNERKRFNERWKKSASGHVCSNYISGKCYQQQSVYYIPEGKKRKRCFDVYNLYYYKTKNKPYILKFTENRIPLLQGDEDQSNLDYYK